MADPYEFPSAPSPKGPAISIMTIIGIAFAAFMVWQVATTLGDAEERIEQLSIQPGDEIEYNYVARLPDGRLFDTNDQEVARAANITEGYEMAPGFTYVPQSATIDPENPGLPWGAAADQAVLGTPIGATVTFTVEGGSGGWEPFTPNAPGIPRELQSQPFQRAVFLQEAAAAAQEGKTGNQNFNLDQLNEDIGPLHNDFVFNANTVFPPSWDIIIDDVNFDNRSITFHHSVTHRQTFPVEQMDGEVTVLITQGDTRLSYRLDLDPGTGFTVMEADPLNAAGFSPGSYRVVAVDDEYINLEYNPNTDPTLIGQPLEIQFEVVSKKGVTGATIGTANQDPPDDGHTDHSH